MTGFATATALAKGDFNNDGFADLAVADIGQNALLTYLGDGSGTNFTLSKTIPIGGPVSGIAVADFDSATPVSAREDTALVFSSANHNDVTVSDDGTGTDTVHLSVAHGTLTVAGTAGLTVTGDGTDTVTLRGLSADLNAALDGLVTCRRIRHPAPMPLVIETIPAPVRAAAATSHHAVNDAPVLAGTGPLPITFSYTEGDAALRGRLRRLGERSHHYRRPPNPVNTPGDVRFH